MNLEFSRNILVKYSNNIFIKSVQWELAGGVVDERTEEETERQRG